MKREKLKSISIIDDKSFEYNYEIMNSNSMSTLDYYNNNYKDFISGTLDVDFTSTQDRFLKLLPKNAHILDFGCGSGRDTKYFIEKGYMVDACDGSEEMCRFASEFTGTGVKHMLFQELDEKEKYDGIWACASILHATREELPDILTRMKTALKKGGIIYTSFKYGDFEGERNGRYFTNMTEESFSKLIKGIDDLKIEECWVSTDVRPGREDEKWLNLILRKN